MKIFNIRFGKNYLFPNGFFIDFCTDDGVRSNAGKPEFYMPAFKIIPALYSQVIIGVVGLNATGKTTILDAISLIMSILIGDQKLNESNVRTRLDKFFLFDSSSTLDFCVEFQNNSKVYRLESTVEYTSDLYSYKQEKLSITTTSQYKKNKYFSEVRTRDIEKAGNHYLKDDVSIVSAVNKCNETYSSNLPFVNSNVPAWLGTAPNELVKCFDSSIKTITMFKNSVSNALEVSVTFNRKAGNKRHSNESTNQNKKIPIDSILSSGTIKGITMLPSIIEVLKNGGYFIADELENHFNKKIIEFILGLFNDKRTNPKGACLIFSTHYPELLDFLSRKDNIYITTRNNDDLQLTRLSDCKEVPRNDISKSRIILSNIIKGTAPKKIDLDNAKRHISSLVGGM
ncbi:ATPase/GTPase, AAA15 family [Succinivibrio dextrinosolvens DSM 3072]|uniref:ATPase/GTPase, AAA15 family n=1 Tax=Succinivibrio dextrinosolvens DSM 3072 TaxID=1123324 RepID=A0A1T4VHI4_9GAMM|nr:AAA family ATPase [Succinivibrio dextrinosolvens]SKA64399.1 ATPase/GTPase, AAA15 family [Succinivibrio dextrinosolvens DSM 3072]